MTLIKLNLKDFKRRAESGKVIFTLKDLERFPEWPESPIIELIHGALFMTPSPSVLHQTVSKKLFTLLNSYIQEHKLGEVFYAPIDVVFSEENVVVPDLIYIAEKNKPIIQKKPIKGVPDIIIEILSSNIKQDRDYKYALYAQYEVPEYWILNPKEKQVELYTHPVQKDEQKFLYQSKVVYNLGETLGSIIIPNFELQTSDLFNEGD